MTETENACCELSMPKPQSKTDLKFECGTYLLIHSCKRKKMDGFAVILF